MKAGIGAAAEDPGCTICRARIHQVFGTRAST
jgi:hypothetical protein